MKLNEDIYVMFIRSLFWLHKKSIKRYLREVYGSIHPHLLATMLHCFDIFVFSFEILKGHERLTNIAVSLSAPNRSLVIASKVTSKTNSREERKHHISLCMTRPCHRTFYIYLLRVFRQMLELTFRVDFRIAQIRDCAKSIEHWKKIRNIVPRASQLRHFAGE